MKRIIAIATVTLLMVGCSDEAPKCSDDETKNLVIQIANEQLVKTSGQTMADSVEMLVENIRTTDTNEKVGSFECAADLKLTGTAGSNSIPITYTSELADDGDSFYVNVLGL